MSEELLFFLGETKEVLGKFLVVVAEEGEVVVVVRVVLTHDMYL